MINVNIEDSDFNTGLLLKKITESIKERNISALNLEKGKEYLITWDKTTHQLSLGQDINKVVYIKNIIFLNISQTKDDLLNNTLFERLISDIDININNEFFNIEQLEVINDGKNKNIDIKYYAMPKLESIKMFKIKQALELEIDVSIISSFFKPEFNDKQLHQILFGLISNLDVSKYAKIEFNWKQMKQIRLGLEKKLDISIYANHKFNYLQMMEIRFGLEDNIDVYLYSNPCFSSNEMLILRKKLKNRKNKKDYSDLLDFRTKEQREHIFNILDVRRKHPLFLKLKQKINGRIYIPYKKDIV